MSEFVLVDTDVFSYLLKKDTRADEHRAILPGKTLLVSFQTVAELYRWMKKRQWSPEKVHSLNETLKQYVIVPYDNQVALYWAEIMVYRESIGKRIECADAWIAACAVRFGIPLVTGNKKDFEPIPGLTLL